MPLILNPAKYWFFEAVITIRIRSYGVRQKRLDLIDLFSVSISNQVLTYFLVFSTSQNDCFTFIWFITF
ncbi:protein of unknown function [Candidatus Nitrosocosmicus franklandus]|uniref:Uncharacterized protein n=1 Tax=Candidatus Nitrosocosmicus franklandianus TaxID=1798806 RepID=A0A484II73_9ARCH|nr:protein of unknown function [Candidatus Nitrosocosmicus franklandus]